MRRHNRQRNQRTVVPETGTALHKDLVRDLRRHGGKLYGTAWCANCKQQKSLLYNMDPARWKEVYVDCDLLLNSLETAKLRKVPAWKIAGDWHIGMQTVVSLRKLLDEKVGKQNLWPIGGDGSMRRHKRRGQWAKQDYAQAVRTAVVQGHQAAQLTAMHPPQLLPSSALPLEGPSLALPLQSSPPSFALSLESPSLALPPQSPPQAVPAPINVPAPQPKEMIQWSPRAASWNTPQPPINPPQTPVPQATTPRPPPIRAREVPSPVSPDGPQPLAPSRLVPQSRVDELAELLSSPVSARSPHVTSPGPQTPQTSTPRPPITAGRMAEGGQPIAPQGWSRDRWADTEYGRVFLAVSKWRFPFPWVKGPDSVEALIRDDSDAGGGEVPESPRLVKYPKEYVRDMRGNLGQPGSPRAGVPRVAKWRRNDSQLARIDADESKADIVGPLGWLQTLLGVRKD